jgi:hypothetical protein
VLWCVADLAGEDFQRPAALDAHPADLRAQRSVSARAWVNWIQRAAAWHSGDLKQTLIFKHAPELSD